MADRSLFIGPGAGLLDGIWTVPRGAYPVSPGDGAPNDAQPSSSNPPGILDGWGGSTGAVPYPFLGLLTSPAATSASDQSSVTWLPSGLAGAGLGWNSDGANLHSAGRQILIDNPILDLRWQSTMSPWTERGGYKPRVADRLRAGGITMGDVITAIPPGSIRPAPGQEATIATNKLNGDLAADAIADYWRGLGYRVEREVPREGQRRKVDVVVHQPHPDETQARRIEIESKSGEVDLKGGVPHQIDRDIEARQANEAVRQDGEFHRTNGKTLRNIARALGPLGAGMDLAELGLAYKSDGYRFGENTRRIASGLAGGNLGGWGGAALGARWGAAVGGPRGAIIGALAGGVGGSLLGDSAGGGAYDTIRRAY